MSGRAAARIMAQAGVRTPKGFKKVLSVHIGSGIDQHGESTRLATLNRPTADVITAGMRRAGILTCRSRPNSCSFKSRAGRYRQKYSAGYCSLRTRWTGRCKGGLCLCPPDNSILPSLFAVLMSGGRYLRACGQSCYEKKMKGNAVDSN